MTPKERIIQIEKELAELKKEVAQQGKNEPKKNVVTKWPSGEDGHESRQCHINGLWALSLYISTPEFNVEIPLTTAFATLYLTDCNGTWRDEDGREIAGNLFFQPKTDNQ